MKSFEEVLADIFQALLLHRTDAEHRISRSSATRHKDSGNGAKIVIWTPTEETEDFDGPLGQGRLRSVSLVLNLLYAGDDGNASSNLLCRMKAQIDEIITPCMPQIIQALSVAGPWSLIAKRCHYVGANMEVDGEGNLALGTAQMNYVFAHVAENDARLLDTYNATLGILNQITIDYDVEPADGEIEGQSIHAI